MRRARVDRGEGGERSLNNCIAFHESRHDCRMHGAAFTSLALAVLGSAMLCCGVVCGADCHHHPHALALISYHHHPHELSPAPCHASSAPHPAALFEARGVRTLTPKSLSGSLVPPPPPPPSSCSLGFLGTLASLI
ncbi:hypothetical protein E2C01_069331 [Portunus trituberculatus]|uniref:Uncharacterized protein n=1 Tax=Portunus trituberculatus TaxID=210409 RepID=A0A5B7I1W5_PORTR|nr:hypothetical protein [Portunus trituberculatus]